MRITRIPGFNPGPLTGAGNNTYLLPGRTPALVDAATGEAAHLRALAKAAGTDGLAHPRPPRPAARLTADGFPARVLQHETDHLDGVLFFDRMRSFESVTFLDEHSRYWAPESGD